MISINICILVHWTKVAVALEWLINTEGTLISIVSIERASFLFIVNAWYCSTVVVGGGNGLISKT